MKLLIEGYPYPIGLLQELFPNVDELDVVDGVASVNYVGYYYFASKGTAVFILPKVVLNQQDKVFNRYKPEEIIDLTDKDNPLSQGERQFIYGLSVWIYRAIAVYYDYCRSNNIDHTIVRRQSAIKVGKSKRRTSNTFLDIILSLIEFSKENSDWFLFILKNVHRGFNKINWSQTINKSQVVIQDNQPVYINPVTKRREVNFDEELLIIFFSILHYIKKEYGFPVEINFNYDLITGKRFEMYLNKGFGVRRLHQIKYKYFSDKALRLWELCYAFFEQSKQVKINAQLNEFLLVKNFNIVFEAIIDELIGDHALPDRLNKKQADGKEVDHLFLWDSLTAPEEEKKRVYYIGDSKYYKQKNRISEESVAKQYTYARNVISWNLNLFFGDDADDKPRETDFCLRDEITEGYNVIPNFFISATVPDDLSYGDTIEVTKKSARTFTSQQFRNRLFDRDTLLITHYDVNFLYVVSLYGRNNAAQKRGWRDKVRNIFRDKIRQVLEDKYDFYAMQAKPGVLAPEYIKSHFQDILGKVYRPFGKEHLYALALDNSKRYAEENTSLKSQLSEYFDIVDYKLGKDPTPDLPQYYGVTSVLPSLSKDGVFMVMMENYTAKSLKFYETGRLAVPIHYTADGMELINNAASIGSVLFHTRKPEGQHLFRLTEDVRFVPKTLIPHEYYLSVQNPSPRDTGEDTVFLYALLDIDMADELDSSMLNCQNKPFASQKERYDAQYSTLSELVTSVNGTVITNI